MRLGALDTALGNVGTANSLSTAILGKTLDQTEAQSQSLIDAMNQMPAPAMERSVNPSVGSNLDMSV